jgi:2-hydroxychromene-2-carboxylate isomerase
MAAPVEFWFDFISPFAYLAWQRIHPLAAAHGREVAYRPTLFAALLDHWGQLGPAEIAPKREYVFKQVLRRAHALGVPLQPPPRHPFNPLLGLRLASLELPPDRQRALIDTLFRATWGGGPGIDDPATVEAVLREAGFDASSLLAEAITPANKQRVIDRGSEALGRGVFGVPLQPPPRHPFNPLLGLRLASLELPADRQRALIDALFRATWGGGPGIDDPAAVEAVLREAGFDASSLIGEATTPANKQRVIDRGSEALARGVFGVPTMIVDGELFWGDDSCADLDAFLHGNDPFDRELLLRWHDLPSGAERQRTR